MIDKFLCDLFYQFSLFMDWLLGCKLMKCRLHQIDKLGIKPT